MLNKRHGGPKRFVLNLIKALAKLDQRSQYLILLDQDFDFQFELPSNFKKIILGGKSKLIYEYLFLPRFSYKNKIDILIAPTSTFAPYFKSKKISILHDLIYFERDHQREFNFFDNLHHKIMIKVCGRYSLVNACVSGFTKQRAKDLLGLSNTCIIGEGVEEKFKPVNDQNTLNSVIKKYNLKLPFVFYIGSLSPRKNVERLVQAFGKIKGKVPHRLYLFSGYSWQDKSVVELLKRDEYRDLIIQKGFIDEHDLPAVYSLASLLAFPTLYEGFGLPILEAQACGCPVLTSSATSCPEVAGSSAYLINPYSTNDIAKGLEIVLKDENYQRELISQGFKNVKRYTWEKTASKLLETFNYGSIREK